MNISIITINLNDFEGLKKTILSVLQQKKSDFEFIVIDGSSTDGSVELLKEYSPGIDFWVSEEDRGIYHAMNKGIDVSNGEYLLFLNSGDWLVENSLKNISKYLSGEDIVYFNSYHYFSDKYSSSQIPPNKLFPRDLFDKTITHQSALASQRLIE